MRISFVADLLLGMLRGDTYLAYFTTTAYLPSLLANYLTGGTLAAMGSKTALDQFADDDAVALYPVIREQLSQLASDYMLGQEEVDALVQQLEKTIRPAFLRDVYASKDRPAFLEVAFEPACQALVKQRAPVALPDASALDLAVAQVLEDALRSAETDGESSGQAPAGADLAVS